MSKKLFLRSKKLIVLLTVICLFSCTAFFRHTIFRTGMQLWLGYKYRMPGGWEFHYDFVSFHKGKLSLHGVLIATKEPMISLRVDSMNLLATHRKGFTFDLGIDIHRPDISLYQTSTSSNFAIEDILRGLNSRLQIHIEDAKVSLVDGEEVNELYVSLEQEREESAIGTLYISDRENVKQEANVMLKFYKWPAEWVFELEAQDGNLAWFSQLASFCLKEDAPPWIVEEGYINGHCWVGWKQGVGLSQITALATLSSLKAHDRAGELKVFIDDLQLDLSYPTKRLKGGSSRGLLQNVALKSQVQNGKVYFSDPIRQMDFAVLDLGGEFIFNSFRDSKLKLRGLLDQQGQLSPIVISGHPSMGVKETLDIDLKLLLEPDFPYSTEMHLSIGVDQDEGFLVRGRLKDLGPTQVAMFQHILGFAYPNIKDFEFCDGLLNFEASLRLVDGNVQKILIDHVDSENLQVYWRSQDMLGVCAKLSGSAQLDLEALPEFKFPLWDVNIENGDLVVGKKGHFPMGISDVSMRVRMCRDVFEPSFISGTYEGLKMHIDLAGYYPEADLNLTVETNGERVLSFFTDRLEEITPFKRYTCGLSASFKRKLESWEVEGEATLAKKQKACDRLTFGFMLSDAILDVFHKEPKELIQQALSKGWFRSDQISTEFTNFLKLEITDGWKVSGNLSVSGEFDAMHLDANVSNPHIVLNSPFVDVYLEQAKHQDHLEKIQGSFCFDFATKRWLGHLPIRRATCFEKSMQVEYRDISADLFVDGNAVMLHNIETEAEGVLLGGRLSLDFQTHEHPKLWIETDRVMGTTKQLESYLRHLPIFAEISLPFEGQIKGKESSFSFLHDLGEGSQDPIWSVSLHLCHGSYEINPNLTLRDLQLDLHYNHSLQELKIHHMRSRIPSKFYDQGYVLTSPQITCSLKEEKQKAFFDIRLQEPILDLARLVGEFSLKDKTLVLNTDLSHLLESPVEKAEIKLGEGFSVDSAEIETAFNLSNLRRYGRALADFSPLVSISDITEGCRSGYEGLIAFSYVYQEGLCELKGESKEISLAERSVEDISFEATFADKVFKLEKAVYSDVEVSAELIQKDNIWLFNHLEISKPGSEILFDQGEMDLSKGAIFLHMKEGEIDLNTFLKMDGRAHVDGDITCRFQSKNPMICIDLDLSFACDGFSRENYFLRTKDKLHLSYRIDQGLKLQDTSFILDSSDDEFSISCYVPTALMNLETGGCQGYRLEFTLTDKVYSALRGYPELAHLTQIEELPRRSDGDMKVTLDVDYSPEHLQVQGRLPKGVYKWRDTLQAIDQLTFHYDRKFLGVEVDFSLFDQGLRASALVKLDRNLDTEIKAWQTIGGEVMDPNHYALLMNLSLGGNDGIIVKSCLGELFGLDFSFLPRPKMQNAYQLNLIGGVDINAQKLIPLLSKDCVELVEKLSLYKGLRLSGDLKLDKRDWKKSKFRGFLEGKDFDFAGYLFKTLLAQITIDPSKVLLTELKMSDEAARAEIPEVLIQETSSGSWQIKVPDLALYDLRPSLLKKRSESNQNIKPFFIKELTFHDVTGNLDDITTFTGRGELSFLNTFKRDHNLLDVPIELISRIGLDMVLLVPIQGEMDYILKDGKLLFTKLKNSYSENKRSYFYLWNKTASFVDFDGNLNIDIRMKQHVLFRITQLFILNVSGSLENPSFTLR